MNSPESLKHTKWECKPGRVGTCCSCPPYTGSIPAYTTAVENDGQKSVALPARLLKIAG